MEWTKAFAFTGMIVSHVMLVVLNWRGYFGLIENCFLDRGSFQMLDVLWTAESVPGRDFGYSYGLLPLLLQRFWYWIFGRGTGAFVGLDLTLQTILVLLMANLLLRQMKANPAVCLTAVCLAPSLLAPQSVSPAHGMLKICFVLAISLLLAGRGSWAVVAMTVGVFSIPSLPFIGLALLGLWLLWWMPRGLTWKQQVHHLTRQLWPGLATAMILFVAGALLLGGGTMAGLLWPGKGAAMYKAMQFGFFADGRNFWAPPHASLKYYLGTVAGLWITSTLLLIAAGAWIPAHWKQSTIAEKKPAAIVFFGCLALHLAFLVSAYGNAESHIYYDFLLGLGVLAAIQILPVRRGWAVAAGLAGLSILSTFVQTRMLIQNHEKQVVSYSTRGLYVDKALEPLWSRIVDLAQRQRVLALSYGNGTKLNFPEIQTSRSWFLLPNITTAAEHAALIQQIRMAEYIVLVRAGGMRYIDEDRDIQTELGCFQAAAQESRVTLLQRMNPCSLAGVP